MYGKIFDSMYKGTLHGHWQAIVTFQQMIVLADADGTVDMTPQAIAALTSIPLDIIEKGLEVLSAPDPHSRTPGSEGRRIEPIDAHRPWGWVIINHAKYKNLKDASTLRAQVRERVRRHREQKKIQAAGNADVTLSNARSRHTDTDTDTDKKKEKPIAKPSAPPCPQIAIIEAYNRLLPEGRQVNLKLWNDKRARLLNARWKEDPDRQTLEWWEKYFEYISESKFLTGKTPPTPGRGPFLISLDWILNESNFVKIHEGQYHQEDPIKEILRLAI